MKLDKKVKENALIGYGFNSEKLKQYIGKECYFTDDLEDFSNLTNTLKGVLKAVNPDAMDCYLAGGEINGTPAEFSYAFCLPAEFVEEKPEEKRYRPYTLMEFIDKFTVGRPIKYRSKGEAGHEHYLMLLGFWLTPGKDQTIPYISIGNFKYTLQELFEEYEWQEHYTEDFKPFGVEETE